MKAIGVGDGSQRAGLRHDVLYISFDGPTTGSICRGDGGRAITVYGRNEVVRES